MSGPAEAPPTDVAALHAQGAAFWTLAVTRELDDLILDLRTNEVELGTWVWRTEGDAAAVLAYDALLLDNRDDWLVGEIIGYLKRTLKRLDVTPGLTGLWQVSGRSQLSFDEMVKLDLYYAENWSPAMDLRIVLKTIPTLAR